MPRRTKGTKDGRPRSWTYAPRRGTETDDRFAAAVEAVNRIVRDMDLKWGRGRLPSLVTFKTRMRFDRPSAISMTAARESSVDKFEAHRDGLTA